MSFLKFNTEQLVGRFEDRRDVKNLAGKYVMSLLLKKEPTMLADLWSGREDISLGMNSGYYAGRTAVEGYYASIDAATRQKAQVVKSVFPEDLGSIPMKSCMAAAPWRSVLWITPSSRWQTTAPPPRDFSMCSGW